MWNKVSPTEQRDSFLFTAEKEIYQNCNMC